MNPFRPLQRIAGGLTASALAYVVAGFVELKVQSADTSLGAGEGKVIFTNALPYSVQLQLQVENETIHFNLTHGEVNMINYVLSFPQYLAGALILIHTHYTLHNYYANHCHSIG